jgi:hypothetical protein
MLPYFFFFTKDEYACNGRMDGRTTVEKPYEQAGAELCQAQKKLGLAKKLWSSYI